MMKSTGIILALAVTCFTAFQGNAQSKKELNTLLAAQLNVAQSQQNSLQTLWEIRTNELSALRNQINKYAFPDVTKRYRSCQDEMNHITLSVSKLNQLNEKVVDSLSTCKSFVHKTYGTCEQMMEHQQVTGYFAPAIKLIPDTLVLEGKKRSAQNELMKQQIQAYKLVHEENMNNYSKMDETRNLMLVLIDSLKTYDEALSAYLLNLKGYRSTVGGRVKELYEDYFHHPKKYPAIYRQVFGPASGEPPTIIDREERVEETGWVTTDGHDPPPVQESEAPPKKEPSIVELVEEQAEFPGGMAALKTYLAQNLRYPEVALEMGISGKCYLKFVISDQGEISNIKVQRGVTDCPECDKEAIRVVKGMPKWKPARNNGKAVNCYYNLPITFNAN